MTLNAETIEPWEELVGLIEKNDTAALEAFWAKLAPEDVPRVLDRLSAEDRARVLHLVNPEQGAAIVEYVPEGLAGDLIEKLTPSDAAAILHELPSDEQADLLQEIDALEARAILAEMEPEEARQVLQLSVYPSDVAGGLMITEFVAYPEDRTVADVIQDLRENRANYEDFNVLYTYVTGAGGKLTGVLRLRNVLLSATDEQLADLAHEPVSVDSHAPLEELEAYFERYPYLALPVVEEGERLVGVVERDAVQEAAASKAEENYRASQGIVLGEEVRSMPVFVRWGDDCRGCR